MILRKPYAIFIKYFKLFHVAITLLSIYLIYKTFGMVSFFSDYAKTLQLVMDFEIGNYINIYVFLLVFLVIAINIVMLSVMIVKKKPMVQYIYNLVVYTMTIIIFGFAHSSLRVVGTEILEIAAVTLIRDFLIIVGVLQIGTFILALVRSTGFDIKKFDFGEDLEKLDIKLEDNEEFEVAVEFDKNVIKRDLKARIRHAKYAIIENKFFVIVALIIVSLFIGLLIYFNVGIYTMKVNENESFSASGVTINVTDSYITTSDYKLNSILKDNALVVLRIDVRANNSNTKTLNTGLGTLNIKDYSYAVTKKYVNVLADLGKTYTGQAINTEVSSYVLVYEIPKSLINEKMIFKFNDNVSYVRGEVGAKNILVDLKPTNLDNVKENKVNQLGDTLNLKDSVLGDATLKVSNYQIAERFKLNYNYCYGTNKCMNSTEYVSPTASSNYNKVILKIEGEFNPDKTNNFSSVDNLNDFIAMFGDITYEVDGKKQKHPISLNVVEPKKATVKNTYYVEVVSDLLKATKIELNFNVREQKYVYILK